MFRTIATALVCMLFATVLWADCAPDYRSDKRAGVFIADFIINETSSLDSSQLAAIRSKLIGACADEKTDDLEELVRAMFQNEGYFAATVKNLDLKMLDPLAQPKHIKWHHEHETDSLLHKSEIYVDLGFHFHGFPLLKIWPVFPLLDGVDRRRHELRVPANNLQIFDVSVLADDRSQNHFPLDMRLARCLRILRRYLFQDKRTHLLL
jgi:hypothetical protein